ncbi:MAG: segregation/condensation protein A [Chloroflexi bacterium]|nr:segregation/condensation protein A [Chloroflexota bacterium]
MGFDTAIHHTGAYSVNTPIYQGPLDLLLQLIERAELDITRLALAQVTDQYLEHIRGLPSLAAEEVSAFLVIAARLVQIKSEALLPRPPVREEGEEDPGDALARQLIEYARYRRVAAFLEERQSAGLQTFLRLAPPPKIEPALDLSGLSLTDLVNAAREVFQSTANKPELRVVVTPPRITIRQKISLVADALRRKGRATLHGLLRSARTRLEIVVTFLAVLELVKRHIVQVKQDQLFGDIELNLSQDWDEDEDFELEFGE